MDAINYKQRAKYVYRKLIRNSEYSSARRLLRSMISNYNSISLGLTDTDWIISEAFGLSGKSLIRIK